MREVCLLTDGVAGRRLSSASLNSVCSSILSHETCASMTTQVGSAVARYGAYTRLGAVDHAGAYGSLDRSAAWDSLGRHSTISGKHSPASLLRRLHACFISFKYAHI